MIERLNNFRLAHQSGIIQRIVGNTSWLFSASVVGIFISFLQGILITRMLGVEQYGTLSIIINFGFTLKKLFSFRINEMLIHFTEDALVKEDKSTASAILKLSYLLEGCGNLIAILIIWFLAPFAAQLFLKSSDAIPFIRLFSLVILADLLTQTSLGLLQLLNKFQQQAFFSIIERTAVILIIGIGYYFQASIGLVICAMVFGKLIYAFATMRAALNEFRIRVSSRWWAVSLKTLREQRSELRKFLVSTHISGTLSLLTRDSDLLWIGFFRGPVEVGYYKLALNIVQLYKLPVITFAQTSFPEINRLVKKGLFNELKKVLKNMSSLSALYLIPSAIVLISLIGIIIPVLYGASFSPSVEVIYILIIGGIMEGVFIWVRPVLISFGQPEYLTKVHLFLAILKLILIMLLLPAYGYIGAAYIISAMYLIGISLTLVKISHEFSKIPDTA